MIGTTISHYTILDTLGKGGMGVVYKALDTKLQREVCIKVLPPESTADLRRRKRLEAEAQAASALNHPNICTIHAIDEENGMLFIVMEYISGQTIREKLAAGPLPIDQVLDYGIQSADALEKAHRRGIVHRDIKPTNIMVTDEGLVKVLDFGLARVVAERRGESLSTASTRENLTGSGEVPGTLNYMSPEQLRGEEVDGRSDQFSLGIVLYEMLAGSSPFKGKNAIEIASSILKENPVPLQELNPEIPESIDRLISKLLAKKPEDRYSSLSEFRSEVKQLRGDPSTGTRPYHLAVLRRPGFMAAALLFVLMLVVFAALQYSSRRSTNLPQQGPANVATHSIVILPFKNKSGDKKYDRLRLPLTQLAINDFLSTQELKVMPYERIYQITGLLSELDSEFYEPKLLQKVASLSGAETLIQPNLFKFGNMWQIQLEFKNSSNGETVASRKVIRESAEQNEKILFTMLSDMNSEIRNQLDIKQPGGEQLAEAPKIGDTEALVLYNDGINQLYQGKNLAAVALLSRSIEKDPGFAMAHANLAVAYRNLGFDQKAEQSAKTAASSAKKNKIAEIDNLYIQAIGAEVVYDYPKAIEGYKQLIAKFPNRPEHHLRMGELLEKIPDYQAALSSFRTAINLDPHLASAYLRSGIVQTKDQLYKEALKSFDRALRAYNEIGNSEGKAAVLLAMGNVYLNMNEYAQAHMHFNQALELNRAITNKSGIADALGMIASAYIAAGRAMESEPYVEDSRKLFEEIGDRFSMAKMFIASGNRYIHTSRYSQALRFFRNAEQIALEIKNKELQAESADRLSLVYYYLQNYAEAAANADVALNSFKTLGSKTGIFQGYLSLGDINFDSGNYKDALKNYESALKIANELRNKKFIAWSLGSLGNIHYLQGRYQDGLALRQKEFELCGGFGDRSCVAYSALNIAHLKSALGLYQEALSGYDEAVRYFTAEENNEQIILCMLDKARVYMDRGEPEDLERAAAVLNEAQKLKPEADDADQLIRVKRALVEIERNNKKAAARILSAINKTPVKLFHRKHYASEFFISRAILNLDFQNFDSALNDASAALEIAEPLGLRNDQLRAHSVRSSAYLQMNRKSAALDELSKSAELVEQIRKNLSEANRKTFDQRREISNLMRDLARLRNQS